MHRDSAAPNAIDDYRLITQGNGIYLEHHQPAMMNDPYHVHPSIEINYLRGCQMWYAFGGVEVYVPPNRICLFWAAQPHRVIRVEGIGLITNAYVSLEEFATWKLPAQFMETLLSGGVIHAQDQLDGDVALFDRLGAEVDLATPEASRLHCVELQARIMRLSLSSWYTDGAETNVGSRINLGGNMVQHFEKMLRYIAQNFADPITLGDVAKAANVSQNYANTVFKKVLGTTVKAHVTQVRTCRARMLLRGTDEKVISIAYDCGFRSLSSFYDAFQLYVGISPAEYRSSDFGR
ncbi:MAG: helix-turn-helix domain-containing protein [Rhizobiaceae bacterium]|nr:helix-turn-helix domain-containing protein [Rhizobiaceae bacterium]